MVSGLLLAALAVSQAEAGVCPPQAGYPYDFDVRIEIPPVRIDRSQTRDQLSAMTFHGPQERILGLMQSNLQVSTNTQYFTHLVEDAMCVWVTHIDVILRYTTLDIFIAKEYREHSCEYKVILEHEQQHAAVARKTLKPYVPKIRSALTSLSIPRGENPLAVESGDHAQARLNEIIEQRIRPVRAQMIEALNIAQAKVDSPQAYRNTRKRCKKW